MEDDITKGPPLDETAEAEIDAVIWSAQMGVVPTVRCNQYVRNTVKNSEPNKVFEDLLSIRGPCSFLPRKGRVRIPKREALSSFKALFVESSLTIGKSLVTSIP